MLKCRFDAGWASYYEAQTNLRVYFPAGKLDRCLMSSQSISHLGFVSASMTTNWGSMSQNPIHFMRPLRAPPASSICWPILICALLEIAWVASLREGQAFRQRPCLEARWRRQQFLRQRSPRRCLCASSLPACKLRLQSTQARSCAEALVERVLIVCIDARMGK